jgi:hypothetical protein
VILDPQNDPAAQRARDAPHPDGVDQVAEVQMPGGRRGETSEWRPGEALPQGVQEFAGTVRDGLGIQDGLDAGWWKRDGSGSGKLDPRGSDFGHGFGTSVAHPAQGRSCSGKPCRPIVAR